MSSRTEILQELYAGFDFKAVAAGEFDEQIQSFARSDFVFTPPEQYPDSGEQRGIEGVKAFFGMLAEVWDQWWFKPEDFVESGDHVVVFVKLHAVGKGSGVAVETTAAHVWQFSGEEAIACRVYLNRAEGLAAAGLESRP